MYWQTCDNCSIDFASGKSMVKREEIDACFCSLKCSKEYDKNHTETFTCDFCGEDKTEPIQPRGNHNGYCQACRAIPDAEYEDQPRFTEAIDSSSQGIEFYEQETI